MHFFTEPNLLTTPQPLADAFGPVVGDESNKFNISSKHTVSAQAKVFACQDAMMLVLPHKDSGGGVSTTLVNLVLKPLTGLDIKFSPVKYYIYRGVDKASFINAAGDIIPNSTAGKTEFITKFWTNWNNYKTNTNQPLLDNPSPESFGFDSTLLTDATKKATQLEEYFNSANSTNAFINDFQAIKVTEGEWIANLNASVNFEFEIITDTDHLTMDQNYAHQYKQVIDLTGTTNLARMLEREKVLNYVDPAAFFGMHAEAGVNIASYTGTTKNPPISKTNEDLFNDILDTFHNQKVVYLDIRSENGYSYNLYENYDIAHFSGGSTPSHSPMMQVKSASAGTWSFVDFLTLPWPLLNLSISPPFSLSALVDGDKIELQLRINDNTKPLLFAENALLFGASNTNNFKSETDLISPAVPLTPPADWTNTVTLEVPFVDIGGAKSNLAHHIRLHYFRQEDNASSSNKIFKLGHLLDTAYGGIKMPELGVPTPFQHASHSKYKLVQGSNFAHVAKTGVYRDNSLVLLYSDNAFSYTRSGNAYPTIDASLYSNESIIDNPFLQNDKIYTKWQITEGSNTIDILEIVGYNNAHPNVGLEDILFLGLEKTELDALTALGGLEEGHHRYLKFEEKLQADGSSLQDTATGTTYRKFELKVQGVDSSGNVHTVAPLTGNEIYVYGSNINLLCSAAFAAASTLPNLLPDPVNFTEFDYFHRHDYAENDPIVDVLFPTGTIQVRDDGNRIANSSGMIALPAIPNPRAGLIGEIFFPVDQAGSTILSNRKANYPLALIVHANGGRYSDYRRLATHLACYTMI